MTERKTIVDQFWSSNLSEIEESFLAPEEKIIDLPSYLNEVVPPQGSVLLDSTYIYNNKNCQK